MLDELLENLHIEIKKHYRKTPETPNVSIYMLHDYRQRILNSLKGSLLLEEWSFYQSQGESFMGYPVHTVVSSHHPRFKIVIE